jgi:uncharacterized protein YraI
MCSGEPKAFVNRLISKAGKRRQLGMSNTMRLKHLALAAAVLLASAGAAAAATITGDLNLRRGPGTDFGVIETMPAGAHVRVLECGGGWCRVAWRGIEGFASASYIAEGGPVYGYGPAPVYVAPPPVIGLGFGWGGPRWYGGRYGGRWHGGGYRGGYGGGGHGGGGHGGAGHGGAHYSGGHGPYGGGRH